MSTAEVLKAYGAAWLEADGEKRRRLLEFCWAENGIYQDPSANLVGREALYAHIGDLHKHQPGSRVELTSGFSEHHCKVHFHWRFINNQGEVMINGVDFGTLDENGKLRQIIGFFGAPPEL